MRWILWMDGRMTGGISGSRWRNTPDLNLAAEGVVDPGPGIGTREEDHTREVGREVMTDQEGRREVAQDPDQEVRDVKRIDQDQEKKEPTDRNLEKSPGANPDHAKDPHQSPEKGL